MAIGQPKKFAVNRRTFLKQAALGVAALPLLADAEAPSAVHRILVMSDIHIGNAADGLDGAEYLERALAEVRANLPAIRCGMVLGDLTQNGDRPSLQKYIERRNTSGISQWFELAGNHEHRHNGISNFEALIRDIRPRQWIDGNTAWFFLSDEKDSRQGDLSDETLAWLQSALEQHRDKTLIVCSHQMPANTVRRSDEDVFCLHPKGKVEALLRNYPIDLWLFGHEHHAPYSTASFARKGHTTFVNVASMNYVYGTGASESFVLEFTAGGREIVARRRSHGKAAFTDAFDVRVPLRQSIVLG